MRILKNSEPMNKTISTVCTAIIPALINYFAITWWLRNGNNQDLKFERFMAWITCLATVASLICWSLTNQILAVCKRFREYGQYEGRWLQIIPDLEKRPYSIIDFDYNKKLRKYELKGINFYKNPDEGFVNFNAYRFVERTHYDGFYYITDHTTENKNGLGKLGFVTSNYDNLTRAEGYFFDSSNENQSQKYNTILIKCDRVFFEHLGSKHHYLIIEKVPPIEIINLSKDFVKAEIANYKKNHQTAIK